MCSDELVDGQRNQCIYEQVLERLPVSAQLSQQLNNSSHTHTHTSFSADLTHITGL